MVADMGQEQPAQSNSPEQTDAWGLDENGCAPDCPIRILGEMSGVSKSKAAPRGGTSPNPMSWGNTRTDGDKMAGYNDTGTAARFFKTFPPDSLFAGMDEEVQP